MPPRCLHPFLRNRRRFLFAFFLGLHFCSALLVWGDGFGHALWVSPRLLLPCWVWSAPSLSSYLTFIKSTPRKASNETMKHVYRERVFDVWMKREAKWQWIASTSIKIEDKNERGEALTR